MTQKRIVDKPLLKTYHSMTCLLCQSSAEPCHIKSKGSGGDDVPENLLPLCRYHHILQHKIGWILMIDRFPALWLPLNERGWTIENLNGYQKLKKI